MRKQIAFVVLMLMSMLAIAKDQTPVTWLTGKLLEVSTERGRRVAGSNGNIASRRDDHMFYTIDSGDMVYVAERGLRSSRDKPIPVTINKDVRFYIKGQELYLQDENGKEHKLTIEKQTAKTAGQ
jgi:hypothetical protein